MDLIWQSVAAWQGKAPPRRSSKSSTGYSSSGSSSGGFDDHDGRAVQAYHTGLDYVEDDLEKGGDFEAAAAPEPKSHGLFVEGAQTWHRVISAIIVVSSFAVVGIKWFVAALLRKIFVWLEERFLSGPSLFGLSTSAFWEFIFLEHLDFYAIFGLCLMTVFLVAFSATMLRALPIRLAGSFARARRARLVNIALNSNILAEKDYNPTYLLEQISLLFEYEAHTKYQRAQAKYRIVGVVLACFVLFWQGTILAVMLFVAIAGIQFGLKNRLLERPTQQRAKLLGSVHESIVDVLRGADVVATHNREDHELEMLAAKEASGVAIDREMSRVLILVGIPELLLLTFMMPGILLLTRLMFEASDSVSDAINTLFALTAMFFVFDEGHKCFLSLIETNTQAIDYAQALKTVDGALFAAQIPSGRDGGDIDVDDDDESLDEVGPGAITFDQVSVKYPKASRPAVCDVSFTIPQNTTMAVVAESGGGKSTLFRVASGLLRHQSGNVLFGSVALNDLTKRAIRAHMGFVSQDSMLFARSIRENIWYGNSSEPDDDTILAVLEQLGLDTWAQSLEDGLDTVLASERMVSGGQAQRLQIARLLCRRGVDYVLLDECMSALDPVMRSVVTQALKAFLRGKTAMIITHSHDTVSDLCDQVVDLNKLQRNDAEHAVALTRDYLAGLQRDKRRPRSFWHTFFNVPRHHAGSGQDSP